jgi:hypothetical protein
VILGSYIQSKSTAYVLRHPSIINGRTTQDTVSENTLSDNMYKYNEQVYVPTFERSERLRIKDIFDNIGDCMKVMEQYLPDHITKLEVTLLDSSAEDDDSSFASLENDNVTTHSPIKTTGSFWNLRK